MLARKYAVIIVAVAFATLILTALATPQSDKPISWCPAGQHAELTGVGLDKAGEYLATYECDKDALARGKTVAKK